MNNKTLKRILLLMLMSIGFGSALHAQTTLTIDDTNYTDYFETRQKDDGIPYVVFKDLSMLQNVKTLIISSLPYIPHIDFTDGKKSPYLANLEEIVMIDNCFPNGWRQVNISCFSGTKLKKITIKNSGEVVYHLNMDNTCLSADSIVCDKKFSGLIIKRANITDLTPLYDMMSDNFGPLQLNGGKYHRLTYAGVDDGTINPTNLIREIDMTRIPSTLSALQLASNLLERVENINHPNLTNFMIRNNLLWSLDLSSVTKTPGSTYTLGPQKPVADLTVVKGDSVDGSQDEVRLYLPEGQSELFDNSRLIKGSVKLLGNAVAEQNILGTATQKYFKVASVADGVNADLDLYARHNGFVYKYNTRPALADELQFKRDMSVEVKTYPYIMYVHPATKSGEGVNYYSGTLWLDYDAIVPKGTTVWIVTDIHKNEVLSGGTTQVGNQLVMEMIGSEGALIPAGTAMYVRSDTKAGLYAFQKAWKHELIGWDGPNATSTGADTLWYNKVLTDEQIAELEAQRAKIGDRNLLQGSATPTTFANKREALVLGIENQKGTGMIGFWPFNGTELAAHRCYISEATYRRVTGDTESNAKGATFFFSNEGTTGITHIKSTDAGTTDDAWYSLDGRKFRAKPTIKGVYIHNGKKEVMR